MAGVDVRDQDEGHAAFCRNVAEELLEGLEAACRCADPDDREGERAGPGGRSGSGRRGNGRNRDGRPRGDFPAPFGAFLGEDLEDLEPFLARRRPGGTRIGGWCHLGPANSTTRGRRNVETLPGTA